MRTIAKSTLRLLSLLVVLPALLAYRAHAAICGSDDAFPGWSQLFSLFPGKTGQFLRHSFYRCTAVQCADDVCIGFGSIFACARISIGHTSYVGNYCSLGEITIENDVLIGSHVSIMNGCHQHGTERLEIPIREQPGMSMPVTIGEGSWIGERAIITADVGKHCIIGTGSLVLDPIPDYAIAVGTPARIIGDRRDREVELENRAMECVGMS